MEINKDIKSSVNINTTKKKKKDNNNVLAYFGIGQHENLEMLNIFLEDEDNKKEDDFMQLDHVDQATTDNYSSSYKKNVTFRENNIDSTKDKSNFTNINSNNNEEYADDDYNDDYENDENNEEDTSAEVGDKNAKVSEDINHEVTIH
jgi:hypothetical protein